MNKTCKILIWVLLTVPPLFFFTDLTRNPYYFQIFLLNELIIVFWLLYLFRSVKTGKLCFTVSKLDLPLLSFAAVSVISFLYVYLFPPHYNQPEIIEEGKKIIHINYLTSSIFSEGIKKTIFTCVNILLAYWLSANFIDENEQNKIFHILFVVGFIAAFYAVLQYFGIEPIWPKTLNPFGGRPVSTFGNPNFMSSYLVILFPVLFAYYINTASFSEKIIYLIMLFTYFVALLCTLTRSSWIGLCCSLAIIIWYFFNTYSGGELRKIAQREKKWIYVTLALFVVSFIFLPRNQFGSQSTIKRITEISDVKKGVYPPVHQRLMIWSCSWEMVKENPVLGQGWGLYELFYPFHQGKYFYKEMYRNLRTHANNAHNEILEVWSQTGTVGLGIYLWFLVTGIFYAVKLIKVLPNEKKLIVAGIFAGTVGMFVDNIFGNVSLQFCVPAFLYWWNIGMLTSYDRERKTYEAGMNIIKKAVAAVLAVLLLLAAYKVYCMFMGEINYFKGFKYSKRNEPAYAIKYLENAHNYGREVNSDYELGNCYARAGDRDKAIWAYYQALAANCGYDEIHFNLATLYSQMGDRTNAMRNYSQALFINTVSRESYLALGGLYFSDIGRYRNEAVGLFNQATFFFYNDPDIWNNLGYLYSISGDNRMAEYAYNKALEINPEFQHARTNLMSLMKKTGRADAPVFEYENLIKKMEQKIKEKRWDEVLPISKRLVEIAPNSYNARFFYGNALLTQGKFDEAIEQYKQATRINDNSIYAHANLGLAYLQKNEPELSKNEFLKVLEIDPQNALAKEKLEYIRNNLR